jgi:hypothetical protein
MVLQHRFYPRRKNELTFKGDFWVNDSTFAIKSINMAVNKKCQYQLGKRYLLRARI